MPHCHSADASRNGPHLCASPFRMKAPSARFSGSLHLPLPVLVRELLMGGGASRASCPGGHPSPGPRPETLRQRAGRRGPDMVPPTGHGCGRSSGRGMSVPRARPRRPPLPSQDLQASLKAAAGKISPLGTWAFPCAPVQVPRPEGGIAAHCASSSPPGTLLSTPGRSFQKGCILLGSRAARVSSSCRCPSHLLRCV